jgi:hypothetical protein
MLLAVGNTSRLAAKINPEAVVSSANCFWGQIRNFLFGKFMYYTGVLVGKAGAGVPVPFPNYVMTL